MIYCPENHVKVGHTPSEKKGVTYYYEAASNGMSQTARLSEEAYEKVEKISEKTNKPIVEVVDDLITEDEDKDNDSKVVGYCPGCGFEFVEENLINRRIFVDVVKCPIKSCVKHGNSEQGTTMRKSELHNQLPDHIDEPPTSDEVNVVETSED